VSPGARGFDLLLALIAHAGEVVTNEHLLGAAWPGEAAGLNNLQVQIKALRRLIGDETIATVRGRGYQFTLAPDVPQAEQLLGRDGLLREALALLPSTRLLVLIGTAGVGKTRFAHALAGGAQGRYRDGCRFVALETLREAERLPEALAQALGLQLLDDAPTKAQLMRHLAEREMLLVLDNVEQLAGRLQWLSQLLAAAPRIGIVATSRVRLGLPSEVELSVPPLELPTAGAAPDERQSAPALQLLLLRAGSYTTGRIEPAELDAAEAVCRRVDGVPLAIELAAARLRTMSARALLARLDVPLALLGAGHDQPPSRHRSLRDTLAWSTDLLPSGAQRLFRGLGVFAGGCTLDAALAVAGDGDLTATLDRLDPLLAHSLVRREDDHGGEPRYRLLEMVREFAQENAQHAGEWTALQRRHAEYFVAQAERELPRWRGADRAQARRRIDAEAANIDAALNHLLHERPDPESALRLVAALTWWWYFSGRLAEGRRWQDAALAMPGAEAHGTLRARVFVGAGKLSMYLMQMPQAVALSARGAELAAAHGDLETETWGLYQQAVPMGMRQPDESLRLLDVVTARFAAAGDRWGEALALVYSGIPPSFQSGKEAEATRRLSEGRRRLQAMGDEWGASVGDHYLGLMALRRGDLESAGRCAAEVLRVAESLGDGYRVASAWQQLARIAIAGARWHDAAVRLHAAALLHHEQGRTGYAAAVLQQCAVVALRIGEPKLAARLFGATEVDRGPMNYHLVMPTEAAAASEARDALARHLGAPAWDRLRAEGRGWTLAQALEAASPTRN
jgi:predicted ATPase